MDILKNYNDVVQGARYTARQLRLDTAERKLHRMAHEGPPVVDLFSGAGGLSLGLAMAGFDVVAAAELDVDSCKTFAKTHPDADVRDGDIASIDFHDLRGEVLTIAAGVPCQPFSSGGKRLGEADPRDGFPQFFRVLSEVEPEVVLIENVAGLTRGTRREYLERIVAELEGHGFKVSWSVLNAADFGVPQKRQRLFIVGTRQRVQFEFPAPTHGPSAPEPWVRSGAVLNPREIVGEHNPSIVTYAKRPDLRPSPYDGHLFNGGGRPIDLESPSHTILATAGGNKTQFLDVERVVPEYHRHLLAGGAPREGVVPGARRITVEEAALLQTFPAEISFEGSRSSQYTQVGNAVPPLLARALGQALLEQCFS